MLGLRKLSSMYDHLKFWLELHNLWFNLIIYHIRYKRYQSLPANRHKKSLSIKLVNGRVAAFFNLFTGLVFIFIMSSNAVDYLFLSSAEEGWCLNNFFYYFLIFCGEYYYVSF